MLENHFFWRANVLAILSLLAISSVPMLWGQDLTEDPPIADIPIVETQIPTSDNEDLVAKYLERKRNIADNKNRITQLLLKSQPAEAMSQQQVLQEIERLRNEIIAWDKEQGDLALRAFCQNPDGNPEVNREGMRRLTSLMGSDTQGGQFNPRQALELVDVAYAAGSRDSKLITIGCIAAYASCDFDACERYLKALEETGAPLNESFVNNLAKAKESCESENQRREQDVNLPIVQIETTRGIIEVELYEDQAPHAVNQFITLVESGFYQNQPLFFVKSGQVALTGCPQGDGRGNAGYYIPDERKVENARKHVIGSLSLVHNEATGLASSQFAFSYQCSPDRDGEFTVFGRVISGLDVLFSIPHFNSLVRATRQPERIISTRVTRKRAQPYQVLEKIEIKQ